MGTEAVPPNSPSEIFARRMKAEREKRGWSAQRLSEEIAAVGGDLSRSSIAKLESRTKGRRGVSLDEATMIAVALKVPLPLMFLAIDKGDPVALTPQMEVHPWRAFDWLRGEGWPVDRDVPAWSAGNQPVVLYNMVADAQEALHEASLAVRLSSDSDKATSIERYSRALRAFAEAVAAIQREGLSAKGLVNERLKDLKKWQRDAAELGISLSEGN